MVGNGLQVQGLVSHLALLEIDFISMEDVMRQAVLDLLVVDYISRRLSRLVWSVHARQ